MLIVAVIKLNGENLWKTCVSGLQHEANYSPLHGFWQSFVTIGLRNCIMTIISTYVGNTKKVRSREDDNYSDWAIISYGVYKRLYHISCLLQIIKSFIRSFFKNYDYRYCLLTT